MFLCAVGLVTIVYYLTKQILMVAKSFSWTRDALPNKYEGLSMLAWRKNYSMYYLESKCNNVEGKLVECDFSFNSSNRTIALVPHRILGLQGRA